jgi:hypothetical protein
LQQYRHETDMPTALPNVRFLGESGKHVLALSFSGFDPFPTFQVADPTRITRLAEKHSVWFDQWEWSGCW